MRHVRGSSACGAIGGKQDLELEQTISQLRTPIEFQETRMEKEGQQSHDALLTSPAAAVNITTAALSNQLQPRLALGHRR